jgi:hypothetical protein
MIKKIVSNDDNSDDGYNNNNDVDGTNTENV